MTPTHATELVTGFYQQLLSGDVATALEAGLDANAVWDNPLPKSIPFGGRFEGRAGAAHYLELLFAAIEIESLLAKHPAVKLAQVVGVPDPRLQEVAAAFVELNEGYEATAEELIAFCKDEIASFKVPRHVRFVTEWPMSSTKVQKYRLRETFVEADGGVSVPS